MLEEPTTKYKHFRVQPDQDPQTYMSCADDIIDMLESFNGHTREKRVNRKSGRHLSSDYGTEQRAVRLQESLTRVGIEVIVRKPCLKSQQKRGKTQLCRFAVGLGPTHGLGCHGVGQRRRRKEGRGEDSSKVTLVE